jgi:hypothetical protein
MDFLDRIVVELDYIYRSDMSQAELNICDILVEAELGVWDIDEDGNTIFMRA